jgi:hypothetical protein
VRQHSLVSAKCDNNKKQSSYYRRYGTGITAGRATFGLIELSSLRHDPLSPRLVATGRWIQIFSREEYRRQQSHNVQCMIAIEDKDAARTDVNTVIQYLILTSKV